LCDVELQIHSSVFQYVGKFIERCKSEPEQKPFAFLNPDAGMPRKQDINKMSAHRDCGKGMRLLKIPHFKKHFFIINGNNIQMPCQFYIQGVSGYSSLFVYFCRIVDGR
jgi:hypothetical protein